MKQKVDYTLYLVTDRQLMSTKTIEEGVENAIIGGCTLVQLREKDLSSYEFYTAAMGVKEVTRKCGVPLIINDRVDIAVAVDAEGVHVGQNDLPADKVRQIIGPEKILGVSASNLAEAMEAQKAGADYIGVGAMYATDTKTDAETTSINELRLIRQSVELPIVVIGGINKNTIKDFAGIEIDGLAVVSAIIAQYDIENAAREIKKLFIEGRKLVKEKKLCHFQKS